MSRLEKLFAKLRNHDADNSWTFSEVVLLLEGAGYALDCTTGSHHIFRAQNQKHISIPRHGDKVKSGYIKLIRKEIT
jgi:predicted RNA binding protein YcfA (HicA-like mRNA interferase family)